MIWLDDIEARLVGLGLPWEAKDDQGTSHRGTVRDDGGEAVAITYCTSMDLVHGREMARVIAAMPGDLRRLLRVARAAEALLGALDDVSIEHVSHDCPAWGDPDSDCTCGARSFGDLEETLRAALAEESR